MITEDYVSFEIAKLLKEKGFDADIITYRDYFIQDGNIVIPLQECLSKDRVKTPTLQMAVKWLREVHYYNIEIDTLGMMELSTLSWRCAVYYLVNQNECYCEDGFNSYEEACEAAIKYCLENLI